MNWLGNLVQKDVDPEDTVLDLGCDKMYSISDVYPHYERTSFVCKSILGIHAYRSSLEFLKDRKGVDVLQGDLRALIPLKSKSFDIVLLLDVLEHLTQVDIKRILKEAERVAKKKIIILTPATFHRNLESVRESENPYQEHKSLLSEEEFLDRNYQVFLVFDGDQEYFYAVKRLAYRILHIWDQAGVASLIAKTQREQGLKAEVFLLRVHDGYGISQHYGARLLDDKMFYDQVVVSKRVSQTKLGSIIYSFLRVFRNIRAVLRVRSVARDCDIIHVHSIYYTIPFLPGKPRVIEFHGDDVRVSLTDHRKPISKYLKILASIFVKVFWRTELFLVSTPDLLVDVPYSAWIPNPVDVEMFAGSNPASSRKAVYFRNWYEKGVSAKGIAKKRGLDLTVLDRTRNEFIPYGEMSGFLQQFEFFIDRYVIHSLSKTALESLSLGLKVIRYDGKVIEGLPPYHKPENVVKRLNYFYEKVLN